MSLTRCKVWDRVEKTFFEPWCSNDESLQETLERFNSGAYTMCWSLGRCDSNGKEIFEGDFLMATEDQGRGRRYRVVFFPILMRFGVLNQEGAFVTNFSLEENALKEYEISGNYYEESK